MILNSVEFLEDNNILNQSMVYTSFRWIASCGRSESGVSSTGLLPDNPVLAKPSQFNKNPKALHVMDMLSVIPSRNYCPGFKKYARTHNLREA